MGAEDDAAGVRRVQVIYDPNDEAKVLLDQEFDGNGKPIHGPGAVGNLHCTDTQGEDAYCNQAGELVMRDLIPGPQALQIIVEDFAGNLNTSEAYFTNANLGTAMDLVQNRLGQYIVDHPALPDGIRLNLMSASQRLASGVDQAELFDPDISRPVPIFLGGALRATESAVIQLVNAVNADDGTNRDFFQAQLSMLMEVASAELSLYDEHIRSLGLNLDRAAYLITAYHTDMEFSDSYREAMEAAQEAENWTQAAANSLQSFFHLKSAHSAWMMDYHVAPRPDDEQHIVHHYQLGRDILAAMRDEINAYLGLVSKPSEVEMEQIRDRLSGVIDDLDILLQFGFDDRGLTDQAYVQALLNLRDVANFSSTAGNNGTWVRNYQWSMMQVVRWMTHASLETARLYTGENYPLYRNSSDTIREGVTMLDAREVQAVIDLYGSVQKAECPIVAVYHCFYLSDEEDQDVDQSILEGDVDDACWDLMLRPSEWEDADPAAVPAECRFGAGEGNGN